MVAAVESDSEHTISRGFRQAAAERNLVLPQAGGFEALKGRGIKANRDGHAVYVGGPRLLETLKVALPESLQRFTSLAEARGQTVVYLLQDEQAVCQQSRDDEYLQARLRETAPPPTRWYGSLMRRRCGLSREQKRGKSPRLQRIGAI